MRDHGVPAHSDISQRPVTPDYVFRPHRCQSYFLRGCNSLNGWIGWGFKSTCIRSSFSGLGVGLGVGLGLALALGLGLGLGLGLELRLGWGQG